MVIEVNKDIDRYQESVAMGDFLPAEKPLSGDGTQPSDQLSFFWDDFICSKTIFAEWKYAGRGKKRRR